MAVTAPSNGNNRRSGQRQQRQNQSGSQAEQMRQILETLRASADMQSQASRTTEQLAQQMAQIPDLFNRVMDSIVAPEYGPGYGPGGGGRGGGTPRARDNQTSRPVHGSGPAPSRLHPQAVHRDLSLDAYRQHQSAGGLSQLRSHAQSALGDLIHRQWGASDKTYRAHTYDEAGNVTHYASYNKMGIQTGVHEAGSAEMTGAAKGAAVSKVAGGLAEGGISGALRAIPVVGGVIGGVAGAMDIARDIGNQRAKNAQFQSIYGGTNMQGMGQRFDQEGFKLGQLFSGGLTGAQADEAFQGVSSLGYQGGQRSRALNFITSSYKSMGMDPNQSLQLVATAAQNFGLSLTDLEKNLKSVTAAAKATGQNANVLRQQMIQGTQAATQAGAGANAGIFGTAFTNAGQGASRGLAGVDLSALTGTQAMSLAGSMLGMTPGQYEASGATNSSVAGQGGQKVLDAIFNPFLSSAVTAAITDAVNKNGGAAKVANEAPMLRTIGRQLLTQGLIVSVDAIRQNGNALVPGIFGNQSQTGDDAVMQAFVGWFVSRKMGAGDTMNLAGQISKATTPGGGSATARSTMTNTEYLQMARTTVAPGQLRTGPGQSTDRNAVQQWEMTNKIKDPVLEHAYALLQDTGKIKIGDKTMTLADALKNKDYVAAIDNGTATVASGGGVSPDDVGSTLASLGISNQQNAGSPTAVTDGTTLTTPSGITLMIKGNADLLKKLGISATQDPTVTAGAGAGAPPAIGTTGGRSK